MSAYLCSVHNHCDLCDGSDSPDLVAKRACELGVRYLGFSSHSHTPVPEDQNCVLPADMSEYISAVLRLREEYRGRMDILLGIEWDSLSGPVPDGFDYRIGSVHHLSIGEHFVPVDWSAQRFSSSVSQFFSGDPIAFAEEYYRSLGTVADSKPDIIGHFDLVSKFNENSRFFRESEPRYRAAALEALSRVSPAHSLLEINTGAMARGYRTSPYPALFILKAWKDMGGKIIISSDSHSADAVCFAYSQAVDWAKAAGFVSAVMLTGRGRAEYTL